MYLMLQLVFYSQKELQIAPNNLIEVKSLKHKSLSRLHGFHLSN